MAHGSEPHATVANLDMAHGSEPHATVANLDMAHGSEPHATRGATDIVDWTATANRIGNRRVL